MISRSVERLVTKSRTTKTYSRETAHDRLNRSISAMTSSSCCATVITMPCIRRGTELELVFESLRRWVREAAVIMAVGGPCDETGIPMTVL